MRGDVRCKRVVTQWLVLLCTLAFTAGRSPAPAAADDGATTAPIAAPAPELPEKQQGALWVFDRIVLRGPWGEQPGEIGKVMWDADASPEDTIMVIRGPRDLTVTPDGRLCLTDTYNHRVQCFGPDGMLQWVVGRKGLERGEFWGPVARAVIGPSGDVYASQFPPERPEDAEARARWERADREAWRRGVMRLTPAGRLVFSTYDSATDDATFLTETGDNPPWVRKGFWVDRRGRIYQFMRSREECGMARFDSDGRLKRTWPMPTDLTAYELLLAPGDVFMAVKHTREAVPAGDGRWRHPILIRRWNSDGEALPPIKVEVTGVCEEWYASIPRPDAKGRMVIGHTDVLLRPHGAGDPGNLITTLLLVSPEGEVLGQQGYRELLAQAPGFAAQAPGDGFGSRVDSSGHLYFSLLFEDEYQIARFRLRE
ncbi:MAG: hypothetical protein HY321_19050 [Armatimonadetes bacterium]|nr:hypothetical protein [Armatimonadota bacterium]